MPKSVALNNFTVPRIWGVTDLRWQVLDAFLSAFALDQESASHAVRDLVKIRASSKR